MGEMDLEEDKVSSLENCVQVTIRYLYYTLKQLFNRPLCVTGLKCLPCPKRDQERTVHEDYVPPPRIRY